MMRLLQPGELKDELYRCKICSQCFMFYSDVDDHLVDTGHASIDIIRLKDSNALGSVVEKGKLLTARSSVYHVYLILYS